MRRGLLALLATLLVSCGASQEGAVTVPAMAQTPRSTRPDPHDEPLALLPPNPVFWARLDASALRASPHYETVMDLLERRRIVQRAALAEDVGFDVFANATTVAIALYAPDSRMTTTLSEPLPVVMIRGTFDRERLLAEVRGRSGGPTAVHDVVEDELRFSIGNTRAYVFPAEDVMLFFDPSLVRRVSRRLRGQEQRSARYDQRFDALWTEIDGREGTVQIAADLDGLRALGADAPAQSGVSPNGLQRVVARMEVPGEVHAALAASASSEAQARELVTILDQMRQQALGRTELVLLGFRRLFFQGITVVNEGDLVRLRVDATRGEADRALRAIGFAQRFLH